MSDRPGDNRGVFRRRLKFRRAPGRVAHQERGELAAPIALKALREPAHGAAGLLGRSNRQRRYDGVQDFGPRVADVEGLRVGENCVGVWEVRQLVFKSEVLSGGALSDRAASRFLPVALRRFHDRTSEKFSHVRGDGVFVMSEDASNW